MFWTIYRLLRLVVVGVRPTQELTTAKDVVIDGEPFRFATALLQSEHGGRPKLLSVIYDDQLQGHDGHPEDDYLPILLPSRIVDLQLQK